MAAAGPRHALDSHATKNRKRKATALEKQVAEWGASVRFDGDELVFIESPKGRVELIRGSKHARLNGFLVYLVQPMAMRDRDLELGEADLRVVFEPFFEGHARRYEESPIVAIDPGHGGREVGAQSAGKDRLEKDLALDVSQRLQSLLEAKGIRTLMTRYEDRLVPLADRADIANRAKATVFVSIHFNSAANQAAEGLETYVLTPEGQISSGDTFAGSDAVAYTGNRHETESFHLGYGMQSTLVREMQRMDRGLKKARFKVLKDINCPGILVEGGFLSHAKESLLVATPLYRQKLATAMADSLERYLSVDRDEHDGT